MVGSNVDDRITSFRKSKWKTFDPEFAQMIKDKYPSIWALGGNIKGNDQYRKLYPITQRGGTANSDVEINALELREAWVARHYEDFRIAGVIAQIKWLAIGSRGEQYMKNLVRERMKAMDEMKHDVKLSEAQNYLEHFGIKGMRWGVRKSEYVTKTDSAGNRSTKVPRQDTKYLKELLKARGNTANRIEIEKRATPGAERINAKTKYASLKGKSKTAKNQKLYDEYLNEHAKNLEDAFDSVLKEVLPSYRNSNGLAPSGKMKYSILVDKETGDDYLAFTRV